MSSKKKGYTPHDLEEALNDVKGGLSKNAAAKKHNIPRATIQFHMKQDFVKKRPGPSTVLTEEEENTLKKWIIDCSNKGFPRRKADVIISVKEFLQLNNRPNPFADDTPGPGWYRAFLKRHPEIATRNSESVTSASSCVSENDIRKWFDKISETLKDEEQYYILQHPERLFNADETCFMLNPTNSKVLGPRGARNIYEVEQGNSKTSITVMFSFSASGIVVPPMVVFPYQRLPTEIMQSVPDSWGVGRSDTGWMKAEVFYEYIGNVFVPFLMENNIERPVILFVDGHKSHISCRISELCTELGVVLIALYPNATRILQPADVAAFRPIKEGWREGVLDWRREHPNLDLKKDTFCPVLEKVLSKHVKVETLRNGFRACGLFPWNPDAINYSKCLGSTTRNEDPAQLHIELLPKLDYETFKALVGEELMEKFNNFETECENGPSKEVLILYRMWDEVFHKGAPVQNTDKNEEYVNSTAVQNGVGLERQERSEHDQAPSNTTLEEENIVINNIELQVHPNEQESLFKDQGELVVSFTDQEEVTTLPEDQEEHMLPPIYQEELLELPKHQEKPALLSTGRVELVVPSNEGEEQDLHPTGIKRRVVQLKDQEQPRPTCSKYRAELVVSPKGQEERELSHINQEVIASSPKCQEQVSNLPSTSISGTENGKNKNRNVRRALFPESLNKETLSEIKMAPGNTELHTAPKLAEILRYPESPKRKGKRHTERQSFVLTSKTWKRCEIDKLQKKQDEQEKKNERKRMREEKSLNKKGMPKQKKGRPTKGTKDLAASEQVGSSSKTGLCYVCVRNIKAANKALVCSMCNKLFHERCVPKNHIQHIPDDSDDDSFVCHLCYKLDESDSEDLNVMLTSDSE